MSLFCIIFVYDFVLLNKLPSSYYPVLPPYPCLRCCNPSQPGTVQQFNSFFKTEPTSSHPWVKQTNKHGSLPGLHYPPTFQLCVLIINLIMHFISVLSPHFNMSLGNVRRSANSASHYLSVQSDFPCQFAEEASKLLVSRSAGRLLYRLPFLLFCCSYLLSLTQERIQTTQLQGLLLLLCLLNHVTAVIQVLRLIRWSKSCYSPWFSSVRQVKANDVDRFAVLRCFRQQKPPCFFHCLFVALGCFLYPQASHLGPECVSTVEMSSCGDIRFKVLSIGRQIKR